MEETDRTEHETPALRFLLNSDFTDFQIRTRGYKFNVHRNIVAGSSKYFETVCTSNFKEVRDSYIDLDEEPLSIAVFIFGLYTGGYSYADHQTIEKLMANAFSAGEGKDELLSDLHDRQPAQLHATMFMLAEYYQASNLTTCASRQFRETFLSDESPINLNALIDVIDLLYNHRLTLSDTLRAVVVFHAQMCQHDLMKMLAFLKSFDGTPTFARDFAMKYGRANWLYCSVCDKDVTIRGCQCGLRGLCTMEDGWKSHRCSEANIEHWTCGGCGTTVQLARLDDCKSCKDDGDRIGRKTMLNSCGGLSIAVVRHDTKAPSSKRRRNS